MVEGHSVHRVATFHRQRLIGKKFLAWSPNGRFREGAQAITGKVFSRIEAVGKNLFAFFGDTTDPVVVHIHFGMAGNWAVYDNSTKPPEPTKTNRLRLEYPGIVADLSAMTVQYGTQELYNEKRSKLGEDPLRDDADPLKLWSRVENSKKSIGALLMDQSFFTGPGNIYRAEILFKAGIHPDRLGKDLQKQEFDRIWLHTCQLLRRGYETGSILTVDPEEARALGKPKMRRYIYNTSKCPRCQTPIQTWQIANRTCYACRKCQPLEIKGHEQSLAAKSQDCVPFLSHCAPEAVGDRLKDGPSRLTVKELKSELLKLGATVPSKSTKSKLVAMLMEYGNAKSDAIVSSQDAATEKAMAGESLAVEHIAELAPSQARLVRAKAKKTKQEKKAENCKGHLPERRNTVETISTLTVRELKLRLSNLGFKAPTRALKKELVETLTNHIVSKAADQDSKNEIIHVRKSKMDVGSNVNNERENKAASENECVPLKTSKRKTRRNLNYENESKQETGNCSVKNTKKRKKSDISAPVTPKRSKRKTLGR